MNNPIDTTAFTFWLKFVSLGQTFEYQITEPVGFDSANFVVMQNDGRYARDIVYGNENQDLKFYDCNGFKKQLTEQVINPFGETSYYLNMGFAWILETWNRFGFEGTIEFILKKNSLSFTVGLLDMAEPDTDEITYFGFKIIQNNQISDYKKHEDTVLDMFGTKGVKNQTITPVNTINVLRKATSFERQNEWLTPVNDSFLLVEPRDSNRRLGVQWFNCIKSITKSELQDALTWNTNFSINTNNPNTQNGWTPSLDSFNIFRARKKIDKVKIRLTLRMQIHFQTSNNLYVAETRIRGFFVKGNTGSFLDNFGNGIGTIGDRKEIFVSNTFGDDTGIWHQTVNEIIEIEYENLDINGKIWFVFAIVSGNPQPIFKVDFINSKLEMSAIETGFNTIVKGVRYIDMMRQCSKNINNLPIDASRFDVGGEFYDQVCFNRSLISQNTNKPFNTSFKEILGSVEEVNADFEILNDKIFVGQMPQYYQNFENGVFEIIPSKDSKTSWNQRFLINIFKFGYKTFEQDRLSKNTQQDIHTESENIVPNLKVENEKVIENSLIRSAYSQDAVFQLEMSKPQTADENDDKVYILDIIDLPANTTNEIKGSFFVEIIQNNIRILNRESGQDAEEALVNWEVMGFVVGQTINSNNENFVIFSIEREFLTLVGNNGTAANNYFLKIVYTYTNVFYQTRTNENFTSISGITNPTNYPNLRYSIARNIKHWHSYLNSCCSFIRNGFIRNNYFRNNPVLSTKYANETIDLIETAGLNVTDLSPRFLGTKIFEIDVYADFEKVLNLLKSLETNRGFVRCLGLNGKIIKGFIQDLDYTWISGSLKLKLEEKFETDLLVLNYINGVLTVNDVIYDLSGNLDWYRVTKDYFQAFDKDNIAICNPYFYDKVQVNGVIYATANDLVTQLILLTN